MSGRLLNAGGIALATFLTGLLVFQGFSDLSWDKVFQPLLQALLVGLGALGIGPGAAALTRPKP